MISANIRLLESREFIVNGKYRPILSSFGDIILDEPPASFTGWKKVYTGGFSRDAGLTITQDIPGELEILSVVMEVTV
jgi:hypothetical protein